MTDYQHDIILDEIEILEYTFEFKVNIDYMRLDDGKPFTDAAYKIHWTLDEDSVEVFKEMTVLKDSGYQLVSAPMDMDTVPDFQFQCFMSEFNKIDYAKKWEQER